MSELDFIIKDDNVELVDLHIHSIASIDGIFSIEEIINYAKEHNVKCLSITDHNTFKEVRRFYNKMGFDLSKPVIDVDGIKLISGTEITCRVNDIKNNNSNPTKVHIQIFGADMSEDSPLSAVLDLKAKNDIDCDMGFLRDVLVYNGVHKVKDTRINANGEREEYYLPIDIAIKNFVLEKIANNTSQAEVSVEDAYKFLEKYNLTIASSVKELYEIKKKLPSYERLNLDAEDVVKLAHASGGIAIVAHIGLNLDKTPHRKGLVDALLDYNVDGFEIMYRNVDSGTIKMLKSAIKSKSLQREMVYTGGTDLHRLSGEDKLAHIKGQSIQSDLCKDFLMEINRLCKAREKGELTHKEYEHFDAKEINSITKYYEDMHDYLMLHTSNNDKKAKKGKPGKTYKEKPGKVCHSKADIRAMRRDSQLSVENYHYDTYDEYLELNEEDEISYAEKFMEKHQKEKIKDE